jgi:Protein of unknown function (DUF664)
MLFGVPVSDPKADLHRYLQTAREVLLWKLDGLSEYDVRRPMTRAPNRCECRPERGPRPVQIGAYACPPTGLNECVTTDLGSSRRRRTCPRTRPPGRDLTRVADVPSGTQETGIPGRQPPDHRPSRSDPLGVHLLVPRRTPWRAPVTGIHAFVHPSAPLAVLGHDCQRQLGLP